MTDPQTVHCLFCYITSWRFLRVKHTPHSQRVEPLAPPVFHTRNLHASCYSYWILHGDILWPSEKF